MHWGHRRFNFDEWTTLARCDPASFEARRENLVCDFISAQRPDRQERLTRLQWRIDRERERCKTPLGACIRLSDMMWESFAGEGGLADSLTAVRHGGGRPSTKPPEARILAFRRRAK